MAAIGLVLVTMVAIAWIAHTILPGLPWSAAFALGAIVSPPDAVAATAIFRRLGVPHRIHAIVEGESLVNDATALVALQFAVAALVTGRFRRAMRLLVLPGQRPAVLDLGCWLEWRCVGCKAIWMIRRSRSQSLVTPFIAYLPAERLHASGVLATVTANLLWVGIRPHDDHLTWLQAYAFWETISFLLNGFVFIVIGLQLPRILRALSVEALTGPIISAIIISAAVILVRFAWTIPAVYLGRLLLSAGARRSRDPISSWQYIAIFGWAGMRGVVSLAAAFALPIALSDGRPFPGRDYILFLTFSVILTTLVLQGLTLPLLIRKLGIREDAQADEEERRARLEANKAAIDFIENARADGKFSADAVGRLRAEYDERVEQLELCAENPDDCRGEIATPQYQRLQHQALREKKKTIIRLRNERVINDNAYDIFSAISIWQKRV
jgi:CPA1 family monovalent cation:H+ antiporter